MRHHFTSFDEGEPTLRSDQGNDFPLRFMIALDVARGRPQAGMAGELLDVSQTPADLTNLSGCTSNKSSASGMRRAADHTETGI